MALTKIKSITLYDQDNIYKDIYIDLETIIFMEEIDKRIYESLASSLRSHGTNPPGPECCVGGSYIKTNSNLAIYLRNSPEDIDKLIKFGGTTEKET